MRLLSMELCLKIPLEGANSKNNNGQEYGTTSDRNGDLKIFRLEIIRLWLVLSEY